jgi:hypothetical protein
MANMKRYLHASVIALCMAAAGHAGAADLEERARAHYDRAVDLFSEGNYPAALLELQRAGELRPSYKLYHSIAQVHAAMNDPASALDNYRKYLQQGGQRISAERRREVSDEMTALSRRVATITIAVDVAGAEVWVDDARAGTTPLRAPLLLNAGQHRIGVRHAQYPAQSRRVTATGGDAERLEFSLRGDDVRKPEAREEAPAPNVPAEDEQGSTAAASGAIGSAELSGVETDSASKQGSLRSYAWVGWVATGALAAGAAVTGLVALSSNSSLDDDRADANTPEGPSRPELESSASEVRTLATVTDVLWVAAAAAGGVSLWLTFGTSDEPEQSAGRPLRVLVNASGARLEGSF